YSASIVFQYVVPSHAPTNASMSFSNGSTSKTTGTIFGCATTSPPWLFDVGSGGCGAGYTSEGLDASASLCAASSIGASVVGGVSSPASFAIDPESSPDGCDEDEDDPHATSDAHATKTTTKIQGMGFMDRER